MTEKSNLKEIGSLIESLREQSGLTQAELAEKLNTSQSAVARMEKGEQNFTTEILAKVSNALHHDILTLSKGTMNFQIEGGRKLSGEVNTKTSKNAAVALLCASLLNRNTTILKNMPRIEEVSRIIEVISSIGADVRWVENDIHITPPKTFDMSKLNIESAVKTRSIIMLIGPLIHRMKEFNLPQVGGCKLGSRSVRPHFYALQNLGIKIETKSDHYHVSQKKLKPAYIVMYESGDTVTENVL